MIYYFSFLDKINNMSFLNSIFELLKKLIVFILILSITIPLWYGSTNYEYIFIRLLLVA